LGEKKIFLNLGDEKNVGGVWEIFWGLGKNVSEFEKFTGIFSVPFRGFHYWGVISLYIRPQRRSISHQMQVIIRT
jgi:hypothetical protein